VKRQARSPFGVVGSKMRRSVARETAGQSSRCATWYVKTEIVADHHTLVRRMRRVMLTSALAMSK
jgi:hypothetical protein